MALPIFALLASQIDLTCNDWKNIYQSNECCEDGTEQKTLPPPSCTSFSDFMRDWKNRPRFSCGDTAQFFVTFVHSSQYTPLPLEEANTLWITVEEHFKYLSHTTHSSFQGGATDLAVTAAYDRFYVEYPHRKYLLNIPVFNSPNDIWLHGTYGNGGDKKYTEDFLDVTGFSGKYRDTTTLLGYQTGWMGARCLDTYFSTPYPRIDATDWIEDTVYEGTDWYRVPNGFGENHSVWGKGGSGYSNAPRTLRYPSYMKYHIPFAHIMKVKNTSSEAIHSANHSMQTLFSGLKEVCSPIVVTPGSGLSFPECQMFDAFLISNTGSTGTPDTQFMLYAIFATPGDIDFFKSSTQYSTYLSTVDDTLVEVPLSRLETNVTSHYVDVMYQ